MLVLLLLLCESQVPGSKRSSLAHEPCSNLEIADGPCCSTLLVVQMAEILATSRLSMS